MDEFKDDDRDILDIAKSLTNNDRNSSYGHAHEDFSRIGRIWGALLETHLLGSEIGTPISPEIVGLMLIGLKLSRESHIPKRDTRIDIAGYANCLENIHNYQIATDIDDELDKPVVPEYCPQMGPLRIIQESEG